MVYVCKRSFRTLTKELVGARVESREISRRQEWWCMGRGGGMSQAGEGKDLRSILQQRSALDHQPNFQVSI